MSSSTGANLTQVSINTKRDSHPQDRRVPQQRSLECFEIIWLDAHIDEKTNDNSNTITQLQCVVNNNLKTFDNPDQCSDYISSIQNQKIFLIVSGSFGQIVVPQVHALTQIELIYVFCFDKAKHEKWTNKYKKIVGAFSDIDSICNKLGEDGNSCTNDLLPFSAISSAEEINKQDPSFMWFQLLVDILLNMKHTDDTKQEMIDLCQERYKDNEEQLEYIREFKTYAPDKAIWWYTRNCFLYGMLNNALRTLDIGTLFKLRFFITDLHDQLKQFHSEFIHSTSIKAMTVYRGQGMSLEELKKFTTGGLLSMNYFMSTSTEKMQALEFVDQAISKSPSNQGILFEMKVDVKTCHKPFHNIQHLSFYPSENEVLFSMGTVFRIHSIQQTGSRSWSIDLKLVAEGDQQLQTLMNHMRKDIGEGSDLFALGDLMLKMGHYNKAQEYYELFLKSLPENHPSIAATYNNMGLVHYNQGNYVEALNYYKKTLEIQLKSLTENHPDIATTYNNVGLVHYNQGNHVEALNYYKKTLEIQLKSLTENHPDIATTYNNMGGVHDNQGNYTKALNYYKKTLEIQLKSLPENHPDIARTYNNMGHVHDNQSNYIEALNYYKKTLEIRLKSLPENHPDIARTYKNLGHVHSNQGNFVEALNYYKNTLEIRLKSLPENHLSIARTYNNMGSVHDNLGNYIEALNYYKKTLEIRLKSLPENHPSIAATYNNMGLVHYNQGSYADALNYYKKTLQIQLKSLPENHPEIATTYNNMGGVHDNQGNFVEALNYYKNTLEIRLKSLPENHLSIARTYNNMGSVHD
ncbi:unnamed protein product, partial [Didymodactylos carnosus]